jgi:hypothetical protein
MDGDNRGEKVQRRGHRPTGTKEEIAWRQAERFAKIGVCRAFEMTAQQQADLLDTSAKQITKWTSKYREYITRFEDFVRRIQPRPEAEPEIDLNQPADPRAQITQMINALNKEMAEASKSRNTRTMMRAASELHKAMSLLKQLDRAEGNEPVPTHGPGKAVPPGLLSVVNAPRLRRDLAPVGESE